MHTFDRRQILRMLLIALGARTLPAWAADAGGNFKQIYGDPEWREKFFPFLKVVYNIYPEKPFHEMITEVSGKFSGDEKIYEEILKRAPQLKTVLTNFTYAIPALRIQKKEMARQTAALLPGEKAIDGYIEIGTPGRYVDSIGELIPIKGKIVLIHDHEPGYGPVDILERGGLRKAGEYVSLNDYARWELPEQSAGVITCFIGLHHSPRERLDGFVESIHKTLKSDGRFILRDHDADSEKMIALVALAHDVFNAGLGLPWKGNAAELRYFKSTKWIDAYLSEKGFERTGKTMFQEGDPTKNALMAYKKKA